MLKEEMWKSYYDMTELHRSAYVSLLNGNQVKRSSNYIKVNHKILHIASSMYIKIIVTSSAWEPGTEKQHDTIFISAKQVQVVS